MFQKRLRFDTSGRGLSNITAAIAATVRESGISTGLCNAFIQHTSASLLISENADPVVLEDLEKFMQVLVKDGNPLFSHVSEGPDDMPAHVRTVLTETSITVPVAGGKLALGTWQGIYLWEHRKAAHSRSVLVTVQG